MHFNRGIKLSHFASAKAVVDLVAADIANQILFCAGHDCRKLIFWFRDYGKNAFNLGEFKILGMNYMYVTSFQINSLLFYSCH